MFQRLRDTLTAGAGGRDLFIFEESSEKSGRIDVCNGRPQRARHDESILLDSSTEEMTFEFRGFSGRLHRTLWAGEEDAGRQHGRARRFAPC